MISHFFFFQFNQIISQHIWSGVYWLEINAITPKKKKRKKKNFGWHLHLTWPEELGNSADKVKRKGVKLIQIRWSCQSQRTRQPYCAFREENDDTVRPTNPFQSGWLHLQANNICVQPGRLDRIRKLTGRKKLVTGLAWSYLASTNVYIRKHLAPHG